MMKKNYFFLLFALISCLSFPTLLANKTSVEIKAPAEIANGTEVIVVINVMHNGNSKSHHTEWVSLKINGNEVKRWEYTKASLPPEGNFTLEFKYIANGELALEVQGNCNIHGSTGVKKATVKTI